MDEDVVLLLCGPAGMGLDMVAIQNSDYGMEMVYNLVVDDSFLGVRDLLLVMVLSCSQNSLFILRFLFGFKGAIYDYKHIGKPVSLYFYTAVDIDYKSLMFWAGYIFVFVPEDCVLSFKSSS